MATIRPFRRLVCWLLVLGAAAVAGHLAPKPGGRDPAAASALPPERPRPPAGSDFSHPDLERPRPRTGPVASPADNRWIRVPASWLDRFTGGPASDQVLSMMDLTEEEALALVEATRAALASAAEAQASTVKNPLMTEGRALRLPALDSALLADLAGSVTASLPASCSRSEKEFIGFLARRELEENYGSDLTVSLEFSGIRTTWSNGGDPRFLGYVYRIEHAGDAFTTPVSLEIGLVGGRIAFLRPDPELDGRSRTLPAK